MRPETIGPLKKAGFTLGIITIYTLGSQIPVPLLKVTQQYQHAMTHSSASLLAVMSGGNLPNLTLFSVGFTPFMTAMLVIQLAMMFNLPFFREFSQRQTMMAQNWLTLLLALAEAMMIVSNYHKSASALALVTATVALTAGAMMITWLGNLNGLYGVGGMIVLIIGNMLQGALQQGVKAFRYYGGDWQGRFILIGIVLLAILFAWFLVGFRFAHYETAQIKVHLPSFTKPLMFPVGLNMGAMMTFMLGTALMVLPALIGMRLDHKTILVDPWFQIGFAGVMTFLLNYFFAWMQFNPKQLAKGMLRGNGYLLHVHPGKPTQRFIRKRLLFFTFFGAVVTTTIIVMSMLSTVVKGHIGVLFRLLSLLMTMVMFMSGLIDQIAEIRIPKRYVKLEGELKK